MTRIVSLLPSATEIVCALGYESALVGRSHECDFPRGIERLPVCTESKVRGAVTSEEIHARVDEILRHDLSVYRVDAELLRELAPTHIVTQVQCEVCAVSLRDVEAAITDWSGLAPRIVPLNPQTLDDVFEDIRRTAAAIGTSAEPLITRMQLSMDACVANVAKKPRVATIEWLSPLMTAGNWMPELIEMAGGINLFGERGKHSPWLEWDALVNADPDVVLILPCGFGIAEIERDFHGWPELRAGVFLLDGNQYFNRPGPRLVESLQILAEVLHPERFSFGFEGKAWKQWRG
ncbi:MAG TPA: cobalamin-binding protein [Thermoanaerobaculia bacterium]|nr:cobalamin-binding protein [Thermoanaerobaculia bacterium]